VLNERAVKILAILSQKVAVYQKRYEIGPRLLLFTNSKSYTFFSINTKINDLEL